MVLAILALIAVILILVTASVLRKTKKNGPAEAAFQSESVVSDSARTQSSSDEDKPSATAEPAQTAAAEDQQSTEAQPQMTAEPEETQAPEPEKPVVTIDLDESALSSDFIFFVRDYDWNVMYERNGYDIMYPASMTKIMTAVLALENIPDLNTPVTVWQEDSEMYYTADASVAGFEAWEEVCALDLLYGVMLPSGADACEALARHIAGSREGFVDMMNAKAAELGMENTHFMNCTGLHDENHYSTCSDMAKLLSYALTFDTFRAVSSTQGWICTPTDIHPDGLYLGSTLGAIEAQQLENGAVILGGKTGTEDAAGRCLASYGQYLEDDYILITGHAPSDGAGNLQDSLVLFGSLR